MGSAAMGPDEKQTEAGQIEADETEAEGIEAAREDAHTGVTEVPEFISGSEVRAPVRFPAAWRNPGQRASAAHLLAGIRAGGTAAAAFPGLRRRTISGVSSKTQWPVATAGRRSS